MRPVAGLRLPRVAGRIERAKVLTWLRAFCACFCYRQAVVRDGQLPVLAMAAAWVPPLCRSQGLGSHLFTASLVE